MRFRPLWVAILLVFLGGAKKPEMVPIGSVQGSIVSTEYSERGHLYSGRNSASIEVGATGTPARYIGFNGYRAKVQFTNKSDSFVTIRPDIILRDSTNHLVGHADLLLFVKEASRISQSPVPQSFYAPNSGYNQVFGTIRDSATGRSYSYSGYSGSPPSFGSGFSQGYALGRALGEARRREEASKALSWAASSWIKSEYNIPPGVTVSGEVFFISSDTEGVSRKTTVEPLMLQVFFWDESFGSFLAARPSVQMPPLRR